MFDLSLDVRFVLTRSDRFWGSIGNLFLQDSRQIWQNIWPQTWTWNVLWEDLTNLTVNWGLCCWTWNLLWQDLWPSLEETSLWFFLFSSATLSVCLGTFCTRGTLMLPSYQNGTVAIVFRSTCTLGSKNKGCRRACKTSAAMPFFSLCWFNYLKSPSPFSLYENYIYWISNWYLQIKLSAFFCQSYTYLSENKFKQLDMLNYSCKVVFPLCFLVLHHWSRCSFHGTLQTTFHKLWRNSEKGLFSVNSTVLYTRHETPATKCINNSSRTIHYCLLRWK